VNIYYYILRIQTVFFCVHMSHDNVPHTLCQTVLTHGVLSFTTGKYSTHFQLRQVNVFFNINKVLSSNQENDNLFTPRTLFDGIMFLTACDDDFILKCEWIHISDGSMPHAFHFQLNYECDVIFAVP
jgi:hypothetical protein